MSGEEDILRSLMICLLSPNIIWVITSKIIRWIGHVAAVGERRRVYRVLVVNPEGNRPLGRPRRR